MRSRLSRAVAALAAFALACGALGCPKKNDSSNHADAALDSGTIDAGSGPADIETAEVCDPKRIPVVKARQLPEAKPFTRPSPHCVGGDDPFCDVVTKSPDPKDTCFVANDNISLAERESKAARRSEVGGGDDAAAAARWDRVKPPKYFDRIDAHLHLTAPEKAMLAKNGFVVLDRYAYTDYASAFHEIFQQELPLYVGIDPILNAVFRGTELTLERIEKKRLRPALGTLLKKLRGGLKASGVSPEVRADLDLYLGVAWGLLQQGVVDPSGIQPALSLFGKEEPIDAMLASARDRTLKPETVFGRERNIDFSQLEPRGHYARSGAPAEEPLDAYFQSMMWLSRFEFNIVSRDGQSSALRPERAETPREVAAAIALGEIIERSGAHAELALFEEMYGAFAGKREDVSLEALLALARKATVRSSADPLLMDKVKSAIGTGFKRTARTHPTPEGVKELPVITTMFGPRIVPDVAPLTRVVHDRMPDRLDLGAADVGFMLGHDRAKTHVKDFDSRPGLADAFGLGRAELKASAMKADDAYGSWLRSVLALADAPTGTLPTFATTDAYADYRLNSALVGYGQIRHAFVLLAAQGYDAYGCEIPDAYVEPLPSVFQALTTHVRTLRAKTAMANGWQGLERVLGMLNAIARDETAGHALTDAQRRWLAMVSEYIPLGGFGGDSSEPPKWTGWYFDMFEDRVYGATKNTSFIADYFTLTYKNTVAYLGAEGPRLAVFVVDSNGAEPRAMVGPVAKGFEAHGDLESRFDDAKVFDESLKKEAGWRKSFAAFEEPEPALGLEGKVVDCEPRNEDASTPPYLLGLGFGSSEPEPPPSNPAQPTVWRVAVRAAKPIGAVSFTLLDHHGDPITEKLTLPNVGPEWQVAEWTLKLGLTKAKFGIEAMHVRVENLGVSKSGTGPYDLTTSPSTFDRKSSDDPTHPPPTRPIGIGPFTIGGAPRPPKPTP